jgi:hypothetical protein
VRQAAAASLSGSGGTRRKQRPSQVRNGGKDGSAPNPRAEYLLCNSTIALYSEFVMPERE